VRRLPLLGALVLVAAAVVATSVSAPRRERSAAEARLPSAANPSGRGLGAPLAWLAATGRDAAVLDRPGQAPGPGDTWLLLAPAAPVPARDVQAFLDHAAAGGLSVWALGRTAQPALEAALRATRLPGGGERTATGLPGHPLLGGLSLRVGGEGVASGAPGARAATGPEEPPAAVAVPVGRGEVLLLSGTEPLDNAHLPEADALTLWVRLASRGRVVFDERWLAPRPEAAPLGAAALAALQALVAALVLLLALGRRHGAVRPPPAPASRRTARDYLAALAALARRAGAEPSLAAASWRRLRLRVEREAGVPARLADEDAAQRLEGLAAPAAAALRRGAAALRAAGPGQLLEVTRAAADVESALRRPVPPAAVFDSPRAGG
jgi:hypothetical protein